jgi:hypothetical protein
MTTDGHDVSGRCLCGSVSFAGTVAKTDVDICHCDMCQRWSAGPFLGLGFDGELAIEGRDSLGIYKSSEWGERAFCKTCGSSLYWHLAGSVHYSLAAGALDDKSALNLTLQIFIDEKPAYYDFANDTQKLTGPEVMAAFKKE